MLLDALTYIIDADNSRLNKGVEQSEKKAKDLENAVKDVEHQAGKTNVALNTMLKGGLAFLASAFSASKALQMVTARADTIEQMQRTADAAKVAIEDVDALGASVESIGGQAEGARASLESLGRSVAMALSKAEGPQAQAFSALKISLKDASGQAKDTIEVMRELADSVQGMDRRQAEMHLFRMGIADPKTIELIFKGRQELDRLMRVQKEQGVVTKEQAERSAKLQLGMAKLKKQLSDTGDSLADKMTPAVMKLVEWLGDFGDWIAKHDKLVTGFFTGLAVVLAVQYFPAVVAAAAATWALIAPFAATAAAIVLAAGVIALFYEDLMTYLDGGDSAIGWFIDKFEVLGNILKAFGHLFKSVLKIISGDSKGYVDELSAAFEKFFLAHKIWFEWLAGWAKAAYDVIGSFVGKIVGMFEKLTGAVRGVGSWLGIGGNIDVNVKRAQRELGAAAVNPLNSVTSNAITNASNSKTETSVQVGQVTVQTQATDSAGISQSIRGDLSDQLKNLQTESASGVAR